MGTTSDSLPAVYLMSRLPKIADHLQKELSDGVNLITVEVSDKRRAWDTSIHISSEEIKALEKAEIVVIDSNLLTKLLYLLPKAKWVQCTWTGVEMIFEELDNEKPKPSYKLTRYVDSYFEELMSNYVMAQIINLERGLYEYHDKQKLAQWARPFFPNFRVISDLVIGILGAGRLGNSVAKQLVLAGATVISFVRSNSHSSTEKNHRYTTDLSFVLETCDYICNVLPSTEKTRGLLDGEILNQCKKKPVFINIGRGDIISEESIIKAIDEGWISKAVLDVFLDEPLPAFSPLWSTQNVIITPHVGAIPCMTTSAKFIAENYRRYVSGEQLLNEVYWDKGY